MTDKDDETLIPICGWYISPHSNNRIAVQLDCRTSPQQPIEDLFLAPCYALTANQAITLAKTLLASAHFLTSQEQLAATLNIRLQ